MKKNSIIAGVAIVALAGAVQMANANITFTATGTGNVTATFVGSDAGDTDLVGMLVNVTSANLTAQMTSLISSGDFYLDNHASSPGATAVLGSANAGNTLVFVLQNQATGKYILSDSTLNDIWNGLSGGTEYVSTTYTGLGTLPAGTYVGFEDLLPSEGSDFDRNDLEFVFQNISLNPPTAAVPEPTTVVAGALLLLPFGVSTLRILRNRKMAAR